MRTLGAIQAAVQCGGVVWRWWQREVVALSSLSLSIHVYKKGTRHCTHPLGLFIVVELNELGTLREA